MDQPTGTQSVARGVLDAVLEESRRQAKTLGEMKAALEQGEVEKALEKAREICGLQREREKTSPKIQPKGLFGQ